MAKIFKTKELENEFNQFIYKIIPSLNECGNCGILKCCDCFKFSINCGRCRLWKCKNCEMFKITKDLLFEKCSNQQWKYIVNFVHDLFKLSNYSFDFFSDLQLISEKVKEKNTFFKPKRRFRTF